MSTHRCDHGNVIADTGGEYRCYRCEPFGPSDLEEQGARIEWLERLVAALARRAKHDESCSAAVNPHSACTCGLKELLDELE